MTTLALEHAYQSVRDSFAADGLLVDIDFGWREINQHSETGRPRITWVPGDTGDSLGTVGGANQPGQIPRPIGQLRERFTVYLFGVDTRDPENELAQYHVARQLFDAWYCAMYTAAHGNFWIIDQSWLSAQRERRHGATIRAVCEINAPIVESPPDVPLIADPALADVVDAVAYAIEQGEVLTAELTVAVEPSNTADETVEITPDD
jgi:hypothetical protein